MASRSPKDEPPSSPKPRNIDNIIDPSSLGDLSGGRPGAIVESEEELVRKTQIFEELERGERQYRTDTEGKSIRMEDFGYLIEEVESEYDVDDPTAIDAATLGTWTIKDVQSKFDYEWDPDVGDADPNFTELNKPGLRFKSGIDLDENGIEIGYNPMYGGSNPQDERTILGTMESYMINEQTKNDDMLPPQFPVGDLEIDFNQDVVQFRKSLDIIETYTDDFLPAEMQIPRHVAKWHGYPEPMSYPHKNITNNRFLEDATNPTDWSRLTPYQARRKAVELARAQNADWLPSGKSEAWHAAQRAPYDQIGTLVGTLRPGYIDDDIKQQMQPALDILGNAAKLLSMEGMQSHNNDDANDTNNNNNESPAPPTVFRFEYNGLMKHRHGMAAWAKTLIRDCGVDVTGVVFEAGFRKRDRPYEGGDCWYGPSSSSWVENNDDEVKTRKWKNV